MSIYSDTLDKQKAYFRSGATLSYRFRKEMLLRLKNVLKENEERILSALSEDLGKSSFEGYATELGIAYEEIGYLTKHLKKLMRKTKVATPITQAVSSSYIIHEPLGNTLIMSPWNYPLQLTIVPLAGAIAGGNTAIVKPSRYSASVSSLLKEILTKAFSEEYIAVFEGGHETNTELLKLRYDFIFFTGSPNVGRIVHAACTEHLTPCILELGGKSPVIIDETASLKLAARRLAWGKFLNAGQTCVAPDYLLIKEEIAEKFIPLFEDEIRKMFTSEPLTCNELPKIINEKHFARVNRLIEGSPVEYGGNADDNTLKIEPTILYPVKETDPVMQEEIFGPVACILKFKTEEEVIRLANESEYGLGGAVWTRDINRALRVARGIETGRMWVNTYNSIPEGAPFGGYKTSGIGRETHKVILEHYTQLKNIMINLSKSPTGFYPVK